MKTNINKSEITPEMEQNFNKKLLEFSSNNNERMKKRLRQNEQGFIIKSTQEQVKNLTENTHLQLELELAEIFRLNPTKVHTLVEGYKEKEPMTIVSVMEDMERVLNFDHMKQKDKEFVLV